MSKILEKQDDKSFILRVNVKPNSKKQDILHDGDFLTIKVRSKALQNKANKELLNLLKKKLEIPSHQIQIISGSKIVNKTIRLFFLTEVNEEDVMKKLLP